VTGSLVPNGTDAAAGGGAPAAAGGRAGGAVDVDGGAGADVAVVDGAGATDVAVVDVTGAFLVELGVAGAAASPLPPQATSPISMNAITGRIVRCPMCDS
jgi:hypothetical protein